MAPIFSNAWMEMVYQDYSIFLTLIVASVLFILKVAAIMYPGAPANKILELLQDIFRSSKGDK